VKQFEFKKRIVRTSVKPSEKWVTEVRENLQNVTNADDKRIPFYRLSNLLSLIQMNKSLKLTLTAFATVTALGAIGIATAGSVNASAPGDFLYGLDRAYEALGSTMQFSDIAKAEYQIDLLEERASEVVLLEGEGNEVLIEEAINNLEKAEDKTLERVRKAEDNENSEDGELKRVRERLETHLGESVEAKEQVKIMYENKGDNDAAAKVGKSIEQSKKDAEEYRDSSKVNFVESNDDFDDKDPFEDGQGEEESEYNSESHDGEGSYIEKEQNGEDNSDNSRDENSGSESSSNFIQGMPGSMGSDNN